MEAPKNQQSTVMGDTATSDQMDVASYMKAEKVIKTVNTTMGTPMPQTDGIKTPGNPAR